MEALDAVADWPVDAAAVGVVHFPPGDADGAGPPGMPEPTEPTEPTVSTVSTGDTRRTFAWASVTKPATALAVLVAVEEGTLALDGPAGPPGSTVRHLLAHASGLGPGAGPPVEAPGVRRIYSNAGYVAVATALESASGMAFADYLAESVLEPLGMSGTGFIDTPTGAPAAGLAGPLADLVALAREWARPTLVSPATWHQATSVQFAGLAGVLPGFGPFDPCDWGLGVEVRGGKRPHWTGRANSPSTYGHFGQSGSFFWVDPVAGVLCCGVADRPFGVWAARAWPALAEAVLDQYAPGVRGDAAGR